MPSTTPSSTAPHAFLYGHDPGVACLSYAALTLWYLGYPDQALKRSHEALTLAQELSHPFSLALALSFAAMLHQFRREGQAAQERAEAADYTLDRAGVSVLVSDGNYPAGLGAGRAGTGRGRDCPDTPGPGRLPGHRGRAVAAVFSCPAGRGVWESRTGRRRADRAGRGAGCSGQNWGAFLRGGAVSAERRAHARTSRQSPESVVSHQHPNP